eukprot:4644284-Pleurochrysis_carterae.AAC.1
MLDEINTPSPLQDDTDSQQARDASNNTDGEGTIADRILRRRRQTAAVVAVDLLDRTASPFVLYLCSGEQKDGDLAAYLDKGGMRTIYVDY